MGSLQKMVVFLLAFAAAFLLFHHSPVDGFNSDRIVNGSNSPEGMFQYLPALYTGFVQVDATTRYAGCSSTIISKRHILTAAHCNKFSTHPNGSPYYVHDQVHSGRVTLVDVRPQEKTHQNVQNLAAQTKFYVHPSYFTGLQYEFDIAIIEFPNGTDFGIPPIDIASNYVVPKEGDMATAAGYGNYKFIPNPVNPNSPTPEKTIGLQYTKVPVHPPSTSFFCQTKKILCTANATTWADEGDSGGPLLMKRNGKTYQVGVASMRGFAYVNGTFIMASNYYTDVSYYCDWIKATTKGEAGCVEMPEEATVQPPKEETTAKNPAGNETAPSNSTSTSPADEEIPTKPTPQAQDDPEDDEGTNGTRFFDAAKILFVLLGSFFMLM